MNGKYFYIIFILIVVQNILAQTPVVISNGTGMYFPLGSSFCANNITVNEGGSYVTADESVTCEGASVTGVGIISLPVELNSFSAKVSGPTVMLKWTTATEVNNNGFSIERSSSQNTLWESLGFVEGFGNSSSPKKYSFADNNPVGGSKFLYRLKQIDNDGQFEYSDVVEVELLPTQYELYQNFSNPFNSSTIIKFSVPVDAKVDISIYNSLGELVMTLLNREFEAGYHQVDFNASSYASGLYFYRIVTGKYIETKKMVLMK
ncbi:MAG: T9SS type A sorting domain-containing protein [Candidatus Kariarchaeaceae archaeon]|jgi:hypothetical protein